MRPSIRRPLFGLLVTLALAACDEPDQKAAEDAQREAEQRARDAQQEANVKIAEAKLDAARAAERAGTIRGEVRATLQKDLDAVDRKIIYLKERAAEAKGGAQENSAAAAKEVDRRRGAITAGLRKLETESGAAWDNARTEAERDIASLQASVEAMENAVATKAAAR